MKKISSPQNPRLKNAIRLKTSRGRKTQRRIIVFGLREVQRAIESGIQPLEVFLSSEMLSQEDCHAFQELAGDGAVVYDLPAGLMQRLKYGDREVEVVLVAQRPELTLDKLTLEGSPLVVILESIEKPGNIGAVLRSMDGAGATALILVEPQCDLLHPNCIRASMGSVFTVPAAIATVSEVKKWAQQNQLPLYAARDSARLPYTEADFGAPTAVAFGNESVGLSDSWNAESITGLRIPMAGISDSLNVSVAAAVMLFEAKRQRGLA